MEVTLPQLRVKKASPPPTSPTDSIQVNDKVLLIYKNVLCVDSRKTGNFALIDGANNRSNTNERFHKLDAHWLDGVTEQLRSREQARPATRAAAVDDSTTTAHQQHNESTTIEPPEQQVFRSVIRQNESRMLSIFQLLVINCWFCLACE